MPAPVATEVAYFDGEFLSETDYADAQSYLIAMQRRGARTLFDWGVISGLDVTLTAVGCEIARGLALDKEGRLILLDEAQLLETPISGDIQYLTIAYDETDLPPLQDGGPSYIREEAVLAWYPEGAFDEAEGLKLVLGTCAPGSPPRFLPERRRSIGAPAGSIRFRQASGGPSPSITGWSFGTESGLRIDAPQSEIAVAAGGAMLSVAKGSLGIGTLSPEAPLHVQGSNVARPGPGLLTSDLLTVRGSSEKLCEIIHVGDILIAEDRAGGVRQATVRHVIEEEQTLVTDTALDCEMARFSYKQALLVAVHSHIRMAGAEAVFTVDRIGQVGFGTAAPQSRLHIGHGDLELDRGGSAIRFGTDARITALARDEARAGEDSALLLLPGKKRVEFRSAGPIEWRPAGDHAVPAMTLTAEGRVEIGIGKREPAATLDVKGAIFSEAGGFAFPDGSVQTTAQVSVPIGAVIDWWGGQFGLPVPPNYQICDGSTVRDADSPLRDVALPNLADCFIVGIRHTDWALSDPMGDDQHTHSYVGQMHDHGLPTHRHAPSSAGPTGPADLLGGANATPGGSAMATHAHPVPANNLTITDSTVSRTERGSDGPDGKTASASGLPPYVGLMKLMRIK